MSLFNALAVPCNKDKGIKTTIKTSDNTLDNALAIPLDTISVVAGCKAMKFLKRVTKGAMDNPIKWTTPTRFVVLQDEKSCVDSILAERSKR